jgi:soluble lytic murein transglycosylase-like protein
LLRHDNNLKLALAAYNAGPKIVGKYRDIPVMRETRQYVKAIFRLPGAP